MFSFEGTESTKKDQKARYDCEPQKRLVGSFIDPSGAVGHPNGQITGSLSQLALAVYIEWL